MDLIGRAMSSAMPDIASQHLRTTGTRRQLKQGKGYLKSSLDLKMTQKGVGGFLSLKNDGSDWQGYVERDARHCFTTPGQLKQEDN